MLDITAQQDEFVWLQLLPRGCQRPDKSFNRFDRVPAIEEMFTLACSTRRCLKARDRGCPDPGHEIWDVILIGACQTKYQWAGWAEAMLFLWFWVAADPWENAWRGLKQYASYNKLQRASLQLLAQVWPVLLRFAGWILWGSPIGPGSDPSGTRSHAGNSAWMARNEVPNLFQNYPVIRMVRR